MLVLTRKTGERTVIAGDINLVVLSIQGNRVKLGFQGPAHVPILREEICRRTGGEPRALTGGSLPR